MTLAERSAEARTLSSGTSCRFRETCGDLDVDAIFARRWWDCIAENEDDESRGNGNDDELDNQSSLGEKEDKQGSRHSVEEIVRISLMMNEDEEDEYKDLWSKMRKLPNNMKKIMLAGKKNELKRKKKVKKKKKKKGNSPMDSSLKGIYRNI
jgi:hypothetical protein